MTHQNTRLIHRALALDDTPLEQTVPFTAPHTRWWMWTKCELSDVFQSLTIESDSGVDFDQTHHTPLLSDEFPCRFSELSEW